MSCLAAQDGKLVTNKVHSRALSPSLCTRLSQILQTLIFLSLLGSCFFAFERAPDEGCSSLCPPSSPTHPPDKCHFKHQVNVLFYPLNKVTGAQLAVCKETSLLTLQNKLWQVSRDRQIKAGSEMVNVSFGKQAFMTWGMSQPISELLPMREKKISIKTKQKKEKERNSE